MQSRLSIDSVTDEQGLHKDSQKFSTNQNLMQQYYRQIDLKSLRERKITHAEKVGV